MPELPTTTSQQNNRADARLCRSWSSEPSVAPICHRPHPEFLPATRAMLQPRDVRKRKGASTEAIWPVIVSKVTACARPATRFFPENHLLESKVAQRSRPTEWASEFSKRGAIIEGGSESIIAELVCVWASERNRRPSQ